MDNARPAEFERLAAALSERYHIERELGAGGMATVYLAHDLKHDRKVALKVLRPELAAVIGADRFLQEIKTTANLQHPHILALFDSGRVDGTVFYVMPYVEGESLRDRLTREKQLPIEEAVRITREVASALDYAHRHGVIHRDIKPENILLHDGQSLVADFGIALAASTAGGSRMTETGMSLGTPHYMSPEQAMGERTLDARTDVYALGCVLYEMLTGEPPFTGATPQVIVARVLTEDPRAPSAIRRTVPVAVEDAVLRALEKLPADRWTGTAAFAEALAGEARRQGGKEARRQRGKEAKWRWLPLMSLPVVALGAFLLGGKFLGGPAEPPIRFGKASPVTISPALEVHPSLSPDGKLVAFSEGNILRMRIMVQPIAGGRALAVTNDSLGVQSGPTWHPDGTRVLFLARGGVFSAPSSGGPSRQEVPSPMGEPVLWAGWSPDGQSLAYVAGDSLFLRDAKGASRVVATFYEPGVCSWAPDGKHLGCSSGNSYFLRMGLPFGNISPSRIVICTVSDGSVTPVTDSTTLNHSPVFSPDGRWLYFVSNRDGPRDVYAIPGSGRGGAPPVRLTVGLGANSITIAGDGRHLAYTNFTQLSNVWAIPIPARGPVSDADATQITYGNQFVESHSVSKDGKWLTYDSNLGGNTDLYRVGLAGGEPERLTTDPSDDFSPDLSPDGREIAFHSWRSGSREIYVLPLDGRPVQRVTDSPLQEFGPRWSPDGTMLAFAEISPAGAVWLARRDPNGAWRKLALRHSAGFRLSWSRDGKWIAFAGSLDGGTLGVIPVDSGEVRILLDPGSGDTPGVEQSCWSRDSRTIYVAGHHANGTAGIWAVPLAGGTPSLLVRFDESGNRFHRPNLDCDDKRFYMIVEERQSDVTVVETLAR